MHIKARWSPIMEGQLSLFLTDVGRVGPRQRGGSALWRTIAEGLNAILILSFVEIELATGHASA